MTLVAGQPARAADVLAADAVVLATAEAFTTAAVAAVTGTPGGTTGQVQVNNAGAFAGVTNVALTALIQPMSSTLSGAAPASGGGTTAYLRADGAWTVPAGTGSGPGGSNGQVQVNNAGALGGISATTLTSLIAQFTSGAAGVVPASGGGTTAFLRADGAWTTPGAAIGGTSGQVLFNNGGSASGFTASGDATISVPSGVVTLATVNSNVGTFKSPTATFDAKGRATSVANGSWLDWINVVNYGADPTGSADSTSAIASAIAALPSSGGIVYFPAGTYKASAIDTTTKANVNLLGDGLYASTIAPTAGSSTFLNFRSAHGSLRNIGILMSVTRTGDMIYINAGDVTLDTFSIYVASGSFGTGVHIDSVNGSYYTINNFGLSNLGTSGLGIAIGEPTSTNQNVGGVISNGNIANGQNGILIYSSGGASIVDVDIIFCSSHGFATYPATGSHIFAINVISVQCDTCGSDGFNLGTNGGTVGNFVFSECWGSTCTGSGFNINGGSASSVDSITIANGLYINNQQFGIVLSQCQNIIVNGNQVTGNSQSSHSAYSGIAVAAGVGKFVITNNISTYGGVISQQGGNNYQSYGVQVQAGASDYYSITGNLGWNNVSGNVLDGGTGTHKSVTSNVP